MVDPLTPRRRSQPRREALLRATVEIVGERGLAGTTHRAVTERADVPLATASYYFSSIGELVSEALRSFVRERAAHMAAPLREASEEQDPTVIARWFAERVMELSVPQRLAFYEVLINAGRSPELGEAAAEALAEYLHAAEQGLQRLGADAGHARAFVALALGYGLLHVVRTSSDDTEDLVLAMRNLYIGQLLSEEQAQAALRRGTSG
jgi:DNA-binding transcriptional regulator YbjK